MLLAISMLGMVTATPVPDWTLRKAIGMRQLWLLITSHSPFWGVGCYMVLAHQVKFALDIGYDGIFAAFIFRLYGFFMDVGQPFCAISDRIGREITVPISLVLAISALVTLLAVEDTTRSFVLYLYTICKGLGTGSVWALSGGIIVKRRTAFLRNTFVVNNLPRLAV